MRARMTLGLFCLLTLWPNAIAQQRSPQTTTITVLQLNDVYQISPVDRGRRGGLARVATLRKKIISESPNTLFMLAGDFISPSVASRFFKGKQMIDTLNAAGLDVATFGNHEFDFGPDVLRERMKESRFAYTVANVIDGRTGQPFGGARQSIIREMGGVRVAVFGLLLPETSSMSNPGPEVRFEDPVKAGARLSRKLRGEGADLIIALTHMPMRDDKRLAAEADVDLIVGGHEHELLEAQAAGKIILKMGSDARNLGRIDINLVRGKSAGSRRGPARRRYGSRSSASRFAIQSIDFAAIPVTDGIKDDAEVAALVAGYENQLNKSLGEVIGKTSVTLDARASAVRFRESNLGNFLADVYRQALQSDVALVNGGSIRSDATYGPGEITKRDILTILPFENTLVKVRLQGAHIKRLLENGVSTAGQEDGRFPQVSGMSFTYDASKPAGARVTGIEIGGQPFEPQKAYTIAVTAYVLGGGDGYDFKGAEPLVKAEEGPVEPDVVMEAIRKQGTIAPQVEGRIKSAQPSNRTSLLFFNLFSGPDAAPASRRKAA